MEAEALLASVGAALEKDADLVSNEERASLDGAIAALQRSRTGSDHRAIKAAVEALNRASERFAARRMDRAISGALAGRRVDEMSK